MLWRSKAWLLTGDHQHPTATAWQQQQQLGRASWSSGQWPSLIKSQWNIKIPARQVSWALVSCSVVTRVRTWPEYRDKIKELRRNDQQGPDFLVFSWSNGFIGNIYNKSAWIIRSQQPVYLIAFLIKFLNNIYRQYFLAEWHRLTIFTWCYLVTRLHHQYCHVVTAVMSLTVWKWEPIIPVSGPVPRITPVSCEIASCLWCSGSLFTWRIMSVFTRCRGYDK